MLATGFTVKWWFHVCGERVTNDRGALVREMAGFSYLSGTKSAALVKASSEREVYRMRVITPVPFSIALPLLIVVLSCEKRKHR